MDPKDDNVIPLRPAEVMTDVGGMVDETHVTLAIYGEELDPDELTEVLKMSPTSSHRRGERRSSRSQPYEQGGWFFSTEAFAPSGPDELVRALLERFPLESSLWSSLREKYDVQVRIGIHTNGWNRGFGLSTDSLKMIAVTGASLEFDLYFYGTEDST